MKVTVRKHNGCADHMEGECCCCSEIEYPSLDSLETEMLINFIEENFVDSISPEMDIDYIVIMMNTLQKLRMAHEMMEESVCA